MIIEQEAHDFIDNFNFETKKILSKDQKIEEEIKKLEKKQYAAIEEFHQSEFDKVAYEISVLQKEIEYLKGKLYYSEYAKVGDYVVKTDNGIILLDSVTFNELFNNPESC